MGIRVRVWWDILVEGFGGLGPGGLWLGREKEQARERKRGIEPTDKKEWRLLFGSEQIAEKGDEHEKKNGG